VCLIGELGVGKTVFARALIRARAGKPVDVPSPTFSLVEPYDFDTPLFHVDLYRLDDPDQAVELGLEEMFETGIVVLEWPSRAAALLPSARCEIVFRHLHGEARELTWTARGEAWERRIEAFQSGLKR
jgi:tRNA threonylcarbamoyladenosine biosynthesis protein TsaE